MLFFKKQQFSLWVVSPSNGQVKKLRVSFPAVVALSFVALLGLGSFMYIAGDYTRVQLLRTKEYFSLKAATLERNRLRADNQELVSRMTDLQASKDRVRNYELALKDRIQAIRSVLEGTGTLKAPEALSKEALQGIGGAEVDCSPHCDEVSESAEFGVYVGENSDSEEGFVNLLDSYIELLRKLPLNIPSEGRLSSGYGMRRSPFSGKYRMHAGVDYPLGYGSEIRTTGDGVVKTVKRNSTYGLMVDIAHGEGIVSRYAHLSKALVQEGEPVERDDAIALSGSSGRSTGPHLHYEVRVNDKPLNPKTFFNLRDDLAEELAALEDIRHLH